MSMRYKWYLAEYNRAFDLACAASDDFVRSPEPSRYARASLASLEVWSSYMGLLEALDASAPPTMALTPLLEFVAHLSDALKNVHDEEVSS